MAETMMMIRFWTMGIAALSSLAVIGSALATPQQRAQGAQCAPAPKLAFSPQRFEDPRNEFLNGGKRLDQLRANFGAAYADACKRGFLRGKPLSDRRAAHPDSLFLVNAPEANIASIYFDEAEDTPKAKRELLLEWPFIDEKHKGHVPSVAILRDAIRCYVGAAAGKSTGTDCMPD